MTKLDKAQWAQVIDKLSFPHGTVHLVVDGLNVSLQVRQFKALKFTIMVFVDGRMNYGEFKNDPKLRDLLMRPRTHANFKRAEITKIERAYGKRAALKVFPNLHSKFTTYEPWWDNPRALVLQLKRRATSIQLVTEFPAAPAPSSTPSPAPPLPPITTVPEGSFL
jgi:hypothetical protein